MTENDQLVGTRSQLLDKITALLGGRASEEVVLGEASSASEDDDLSRAAAMTRRMVAEFGMGSRMGPYSVKAFANGTAGDGMSPAYSERVAGVIDDETVVLLNEAAERARAILTENRHVLDAWRPSWSRWRASRGMSSTACWPM